MPVANEERVSRIYGLYLVLEVDISLDAITAAIVDSDARLVGRDGK